MLCCRYIRNSKTNISNHSWGTAVDLKLKGVLDVRGAGEFEADHVPGAIHIPHTRIAAKHNELPKGVGLLVHCSTGVRTASAVSMLERLGYEAFAVDDRFAAYRQVRPSHEAVRR